MIDWNRVEFLLARIAEDEARARDAASDPLSVIQYDLSACAYEAREKDEADAPPLLWASEHVADLIARLRPRTLHDPARTLAECEAKRRIVEKCVTGLRSDTDCSEGHREIFDAILGLLAAVDSDHPRYREEWDPQPNG